jgi:hypothetical protein
VQQRSLGNVVVLGAGHLVEGKGDFGRTGSVVVM